MLKNKDVIISENESGFEKNVLDDSAVVINNGDTNGDNESSATDYLQIKSHFLKLYNLYA